MPNSVALAGRLSTTNEMGPGIEEPLVLVTEPIRAKRPVEWL